MREDPHVSHKSLTSAANFVCVNAGLAYLQSQQNRQMHVEEILEYYPIIPIGVHNTRDAISDLAWQASNSQYQTFNTVKIIMGGKVDTHNVFGVHVKQGTPLYFELYPRTLENQTEITYNLTEDGSTHTVPIPEGARAVFWQIRPAAGPKPPYTALGDGTGIYEGRFVSKPWPIGEVAGQTKTVERQLESFRQIVNYSNYDRGSIRME